MLMQGADLPSIVSRRGQRPASRPPNAVAGSNLGWCTTYSVWRVCAIAIAICPRSEMADAHQKNRTHRMYFFIQCTV